jgi:hypothetical protein
MGDEIKQPKICFVDIETPLIPPEGLAWIPKIFCIGVKSGDEPVKKYTYLWHELSAGSLLGALKEINRHDYAVFHNGIGFDVPVINRLLGKVTAKIVDTLLLAKMIWTKDQLFDIDNTIEDMPGNIKGGYSLKAFGYRFGDNKIEYEQFERLTTEMIIYMEQDVNLTAKLFWFIVSQANYPNQRTIDLEYRVAEICQTQIQYGFYYNVEKARQLATELRFEKMNLEHSLQKIFKPKFLPDGPIKVPAKRLKRKHYVLDKDFIQSRAVPKRWIRQYTRLKNGKIRLPGKNRYKWFDKPHRLTYIISNGEYQPIKLTKFNPGSRDQIKKWLQTDHNFEFATYTEKGSRKVDADELDFLGNSGKDLIRYLKVTKDLSEVVGVLDEFKPHSHSIHGRIDTIGAATHRCTHSTPNVAQTSAEEEFRELYTVPPGYKLVGADLANIEVRTLAHYLKPYDNGKYAEAVLSKDMHWYHAKLAGFWTEDDRDWPPDSEAHLRTPEMELARRKSKGFFFGWLYGQGDTIRGHILWSEGCLPEYTDEEYRLAKARVEKRIVILGGQKFFPLRKDQYVLYDELLIQKTIYGKRVADTFLEKVDGIAELIKDCQTQSKTKKTVTAIDGRELYSRSPHSALNLLLQGSAGVIAKQWMVNYHDKLLELGYEIGKDFWQSAYVHDEFQVTTKEEIVDIVCKALEEAAYKVTEDFQTNIPIKGDAGYGDSWADTH